MPQNVVAFLHPKKMKALILNRLIVTFASIQKDNCGPQGSMVAAPLARSTAFGEVAGSTSGKFKTLSTGQGSMLLTIAGSRVPH